MIREARSSLRDGALVRVPASFRDPSGFVFEHDGAFYRQVNHVYAPAYQQLVCSGLYAELAADGLLLAHEELEAPVADPETCWRTLRPEQLPFVSYPYEWCFGQLKDAALLTLDVQLRALQKGMSLKDASGYNVQFLRGKPVLIDTLSFVPWPEGTPWAGYRQFCRHFLGPLALVAMRDVRLAQLLRVHIDGVPLDLASKLLPWRSWFGFGILAHVHLHARSERRFSATDAHVADSALRLARVSRNSLLAMLQVLRNTVAALDWRPDGTEWADYYAATNYSDSSMSAKRRLVAEFLECVDPSTVWDLGANTGAFSRVAADRGATTLAFDIDPAAVERHYRSLAGEAGNRPLPLLLDLANPSPGTGWAHEERQSLVSRGPADCVMALALIHHLCIGNNVPFALLAAFLADLSRKHLIIEFVPRSDGQVQRLLRGREDVFGAYVVERFEAAFSAHFDIVRRERVEGTERTLYLMRRLPMPRSNDPASPMEASQ